jgi:hypothetical protein
MSNAETAAPAETTYEVPESDWNETPTDAHIEVRSREADLADFLEDERKRENQRRAWINSLMQQKTQNEVRHKQALAEQEELHRHAQVKIDEQLAMLGYEQPTAAVITAPAATPAQAPKRRGRPAGSKNKAAGKATAKAATNAPSKAGKGGKPKRVLSEATKIAMSEARSLYWAKRHAAEAKSKKAKA